MSQLGKLVALLYKDRAWVPKRCGLYFPGLFTQRNCDWKTAGNYFIRFVLIKNKKKNKGFWIKWAHEKENTKTKIKTTKKNNKQNKNKFQAWHTQGDTLLPAGFTTSMASPLSVFTRLWSFMTCDIMHVCPSLTKRDRHQSVNLSKLDHKCAAGGY